jgi:hypothetical protein
VSIEKIFAGMELPPYGGHSIIGHVCP